MLHSPRINLSERKDFTYNRSILCKIKRLADKLFSEIIVVHPGNGDILETIYQLNCFFDPRIAIENLSYNTSNSKRCGICPTQIQYIIQNTNVKFCLDFSHAICSANFLNRNIFVTLLEYKRLNPVVYHFSDGFIGDIRDKHLHLGEGNFDLKKILEFFVSKNSLLVLETGIFDDSRDPNHFIDDIKFIRKFIEQSRK